MKQPNPQPPITRLVIEARDGIPMHRAETYATQVMRSDYISETAGRKHRCHHTQFKDGTHVTVICRSQSRTERFIVSNT